MNVKAGTTLILNQQKQQFFSQMKPASHGEHKDNKM